MMAVAMEQFSTFCVLCLIIVSSFATPISKRQLSCDHPLRVSLPQLFSHCTSACTYTEWSGWQVVENSVVTVPTSQCSSGQAYSERRTRAGIGSGCTEATSETRSICLPDREDSLILALGLGSDDNTTLRHIRETGSSQYCPVSGTTIDVCSSLVGKRSVRDYVQEMNSQIEASPHLRDNTADISAPAPLETAPIQFDWKEHSDRLMRHRRRTRCSSPVKHVLFVLDSSGSIGRANYDRMKLAASTLTSLFCNEVHFALLTFSSRLNLDFCFNCYSNSRALAAQAVLNATYQSGLTNTGAAAKCICDHLLHPNCGISVDPNCLDVIFITDGRSNDRTLKVCDEVACLHNRYGINTYAVGIGNYNRSELRCISDQSDMFNQFEYVDFEDFQSSIDEIVSRVISGSSYTCTVPEDVLP